jgi:sulfatase maturation enzyme AslB (radical SAM superfamily)
MKFKKVAEYQKEYDTMKSIANSSIANGVELTREFQNELLALTKLLKSFGGKI